MSFIVQEFAAIFNTCAPGLCSATAQLAVNDFTLVMGLFVGVFKGCDDFAFLLCLFDDGNVPASISVFLTFDEVALENTTIVTDQFTVSVRQAISKIADVASSVLEYFDASSMLEAVVEQTLIHVADVVLEDAVPPGFVI